MQLNSELANMILKARYYRLQARSDRTRRQYEHQMDNTKTEEIKKLHFDGHKSNHIACKLGLVKEYVDAVLTTTILTVNTKDTQHAPATENAL